MTTGNEPFVECGSEISSIDVKISHRIIELFSEGLYSSSHKAIEELVSNSFDAGAQNVHVLLAADLRASDAAVVVIDDGEGMDEDGLAQHWIIGKSARRNGSSVNGRKPIGKFGIGKLATYVLARRLTHICKRSGRFYAITMDYESLPSSENEGVYGEGEFEQLSLPLRELTETEAENILTSWVIGDKEGYEALRLFGKDACDSWTVAIISGLKEMCKKLQRGRLKWVLRTAMPLRPDFRLFLNGDELISSKVDAPLIAHWHLGKDLLDVPKPCSDDFENTEDMNQPEDDLARYGLTHPDLGRVTGTVELYEAPLEGGKSDSIERSNGFFVYVHGRLINIDDPGFGIDRNLLRHGTFSRLRVVVHIDGLNSELRSSRESLRQGSLYAEARNLLHGIFNLVRNRLNEHEKAQTPGALIGSRLSSAPGSMTRKPLCALAQLAFDGKINPIYTRFPQELDSESQGGFLKNLQERVGENGDLLRGTELSELSSREPIAVYDAERAILQINSLHPFVAVFLDEFRNVKASLPLEMWAMSEVLQEAQLYMMGLSEDVVRSILSARDALLRQMVRFSGRRNPLMVASALADAKDDQDRLENELVAAFEVLGFDDVRPLGGSGKPDGTADAYLSAREEGVARRYRVGLEAKSGGPVSAERLGAARINRHMAKFDCQHHVIAGNGFATTKGEDCATVEEIRETLSKNQRTATLVLIDDLARLVRLVPAKKIGLSRLQDFFQSCTTPEESKEWIDKLCAESVETPPYKEILQVIWQLSNRRPNETVDYGAVQNELGHLEPAVDITKEDLKNCCKAMQSMVPQLVFAETGSVEIDQRPDLIVEEIHSVINYYPAKEKERLDLGKTC